MSRKSRKKKKKEKARTQVGISANVQERIVVGLLILLPFILYFRYVFGGAMLYGSDWLLSGYTAREFVARYIASHGRLPLWHPYVFGGVPTVAAFLGDIFYPTTLFRIFVPVHVVWSYTFAGHIALAGVATYYLSKDLGLNRFAATVGAIGYMFCGSLVSMTSPGHDGKLICASFLPLAFLFFNRGIRTSKFYYFLFAGAAVGFPLMVGHLQMGYYTLLALFAYLLFEIFRMGRDSAERRRIRKVLVLSVLAIVFMFLLISVQFLPVYKYLGFAARGGERGYGWSTSWSLPTGELLDLVTPHFSGLGSNYWGTNYFKLDSQYLGILPLLLAPLALLGKRPRSVKFFAGLAIAGTVMALGGHTPLYRLAYFLLPGVKKFRGPSMVFFLTSFALSMLAAFGASRLMQDFRDTQRKKVYAFLLVVAGLLLLSLAICLAARESVVRSISAHIQPYISAQYSANLAVQKIQNLKDNYPVFLKGLSWALILVLVNAGLVFLLVSKRLTKGAWTALVCFLLVVDLWIVWLGGKNPAIRSAPDPGTYLAEDEVVGFLKRQEGPFRVFPFRYDHTNDNYLMHHGIQSVAGYHGNQLQSYQDFIGAGKSVMFDAGNLMHQNFLDLLNVRYIVTVGLPDDVSRFDQRTRELIESLRSFFERESFRQVFVGRTYVVYENVSALERAVLVPGYEVVGEKSVLDRLKEDSFDPEDIVLLEEDPGVAMVGGEGPVGRVELVEYGANRIVLRTESEQNTMLLLSENYYDQWRADVDGERTRVYRADHTFRALPIGAGTHTVVMEYDSPAMKLGAFLSMLSLTVLLASIFIWRTDARRSRGRGGRQKE